jgi:Ser/Thr protein kinase RdoA (MazF antagonist)
LHFIRRLHAATASRLEVEETVFERWVGAPLGLLHRLASTLPQPRQYDAMVNRIQSDLRGALCGRTVRVSWVHGDFWPSNVLIAPDGTLTGVVDWERAAPDELPIHDLLHLVLHGARFEAAHRNLGAAVRAVLGGAPLLPDEWQVLQSFDLPLDATPASLRLMVLLYWLRYVATYLEKVPGQARNQWWVRKNVGDVLKAAVPG